MDIALLAEQFLDTYGLVAIFGIMLLKELGVPVPIPSDLIMLGAAARAAQGRFSLVAVFLAILMPMLIGGMTQFSIAKGPGRRLIYRVGKLIGLTQERLDRTMERIRKGGTTAVAIGLTTPGVRIAIVPASGLAGLTLGAFIPGLVIGSTFFLAWHFAIGYLSGIALAILSLPLPVLIALLVIVVAFGIDGWMYIRSHHRAESEDVFPEWADASCPACVTIALLNERGIKSSEIKSNA